GCGEAAGSRSLAHDVALAKEVIGIPVRAEVRAVAVERPEVHQVLALEDLFPGANIGAVLQHLAGRGAPAIRNGWRVAIDADSPPYQDRHRRHQDGEQSPPQNAING